MSGKFFMDSLWSISRLGKAFANLLIFNLSCHNSPKLLLVMISIATLCKKDISTELKMTCLFSCLMGYVDEKKERILQDGQEAFKCSYFGTPFEIAAELCNRKVKKCLLIHTPQSAFSVLQSNYDTGCFKH